MKFKSGTRRRALVYEKELVQYWKKHKTFEKSVENRPANNAYVLYDGPPFITGVPHHGTLLSSVVKDAIPRYWTMQGKRVERVWGWDCHGLPAEVFTEKKLGIKDRREIGNTIPLETYITTCRDNMVQTGNLWEDTIDRIGRWVNFKGAYKTMDKEFMESVWWAFKQLYEKGKIYEGEKVLMYCTRDATPLSKAEVTMDAGAYQDVTDPSVYVKFKLQHSDSYLLVWTTTPWTLLANTAVAVHKDMTYVEVRIKNETFIVAEVLAPKVFTNEKHQPIEYTILRTLKGSELIGKSYEPLFEARGKNTNKIWHGDFVSAEDGSGLVHIAPAYGEDDFRLAKQHDIPVVHVIDESGFYNTGEWQGELVWDINKTIAKTLHERGVVWKIDYIKHSYPHCHRCGTKLMYRAHPSWFMDIDGQRTEMLEQNGDVHWFPEHVKQGRFAKTIESAPDWNLSRDRFWATAMPVWKGVDAEGNEHVKVVGSYAELKELSGVELEDYHRPWVDDVAFTIDGVEYKRIEKVMDCWFESGSMPFAQFHYPFENVDVFEASFPGDFISEYIGQVRAWFYYVHAVNVGLFGHNAYKNVIVTGNLMGEDGRKLSKSLGNYTDPNELMDTYSADSLRFLMLSSPVLSGEDFAIRNKDVSDIARKLTMIWNMYDFFTMYAEVDAWEWNGELEDPSGTCTNVLDQWIISRLHGVIQEVEQHMERYDVPSALAPILPFIDDASNWYVRRSRKRFWKSGNTEDKNNAYTTLHYVLVRLSMVLAPFTPFLAEELYQKLTGGESVHLLDWPKVGHVNELALDHMETVREVITQGLGERAAAGIKVRQPLASAKLTIPFDITQTGKEELYTIVADELNVKKVTCSVSNDVGIELNLQLTPQLQREGMMREVIRFVQNARKKAGLQVDDRIELALISEHAELQKAIHEHAKTIQAETLATKLLEKPCSGYSEAVTVDGAALEISLQKTSTKLV